MGDRANVIVLQEGTAPVVIYSHWGGAWLTGGGLLKAMDAASGRAGDVNYYTALFVQKIAEENLLSGVGTRLDDNEYPVMVVNALTGNREPDMSESEADEFLRQWGNGNLTTV